MASHKRVWAVLLALGLAAGCADEVTGPGARRAPGVLAISGWIGNVPARVTNGGGDLNWDRRPGMDEISAPEILVAPDTVQVGQAFDVTAYTVGNGGCWRADGETVHIEGRVIVLKPYDAHSGSEVCTLILLFLPHRTSVVLTEAGEWTLRVQGRRLRMGDTVSDEPITAEKTIIAR